MNESIGTQENIPLVKKVECDTFVPSDHFYQKVLNAKMHPIVKSFLHLTNAAMVQRYSHLHPKVNRDKLCEILNYIPNHFYWGGADLFPVTNLRGSRHMVLIETNSCPSGQKSMPLEDFRKEKGSYAKLIEEVFIPQMKKQKLIEGALAVVYDKNLKENSGYASAIADAMEEPVYLVPYYDSDPNPPVRWEKGVLQIRYENEWISIRAAYRYITQKPWNRIPFKTKTFLFNPLITCLAGGRNKLLAVKAYDLFNSELDGSGLKIRYPETIWDLKKAEIPLWVFRMGGSAAIKVPYSNAGQGIYTVVNNEELQKFMKSKQEYDSFIVQSLISNPQWNSSKKASNLFHIGIIPNNRNESFVADLRMMIGITDKGYRPISIYARLAKEPLSQSLPEGKSSWDVLGTNLSIKLGPDKWDSDTDRLKIMDHRDFNTLGIGIDDLIEAFVQTTIATVAIDRMADRLLSDGRLDHNLFKSLNPDDLLFDEIMDK